MRTISEEFQDTLCDGVLKCVTDAVTERGSDLILCFRDGYVNVYYKSHSLFKITQQKQGYKLAFNIRHARYTESLDDAKARLRGICPEIQFTASDEAWFYAGTSVKHCIKQIINTYKSYIDDFFDPEKTEDYIKPSTKRDLLEKLRQQEIFAAHMNPAGVAEELVFYDMELSIPNATQSEAKKGSPDCLAVKLKEGTVTEIVLVEVKSNETACTGEHGIKKHYEDFNAIIENPTDRALLYDAMVNAFSAYHKLGMYSAVREICEIENCKFSVKFFFTDDAVRWTENSRQRNQNYEYYKYLTSEQKCFWKK